MLDEPVLLRRGTFDGLRHALESLSPEQLLDAGQGGERARPRRRRLPGRHEMGVRRARRRPRQGDRGQRRRGRPRLVHRQAADGAQPRAAARGHGAGGLCGRRQPRRVLVRSEYPRSTPILREAVEALPRRAWRFRRRGARGRRLVRGGRGDRAARLAAGLPRHGLGSSAVPRRARLHGKPTVVHNVETLCNIPFIALHGAEAYGALSPGATPGTKLVCLNERFVRPGMYEVRFGTPMPRSARSSAAGSSRATRSRRCRSAARSAASCPAGSSTRPSTSTSWPPRAAWSGTAASSPSTIAPTCARWRATCSSSARTRAAASASPAGSGCSGVRDGRRPGDLDRDKLEALLETLELAPVRARRRDAGADPLADRPLARGAGAAEVEIDGLRGRRRARHDDPRGRPGGRALRPDALLRRPHGAVRRLPRVHGGARGRAPPRSPRAPHPAATT